MNNNSLFQNESIKWGFTIFTSQSNNIIYVFESAVHYGSRQIGYGPCSVNIHETAV